jgi:hypothetical protein
VTVLVTGEKFELQAVDGDKVICWGGPHDPWKPHTLIRAPDSVRRSHPDRIFPLMKVSIQPPLRCGNTFGSGDDIRRCRELRGHDQGPSPTDHRYEGTPADRNTDTATCDSK